MMNSFSASRQMTNNVVFVALVISSFSSHAVASS